MNNADTDCPPTQTEECGSRGPRIGSQGVPLCRREGGHTGEHRAAPEDGFGNVTWSRLADLQATDEVLP